MAGSVVDFDGNPTTAAYVTFTVPCSSSEQCSDGDECNGVEICELQTGTCIDGAIDDCDGTGINDACELADCADDPGCDDCDANGILDRCDMAQPGSSTPIIDRNGNGVLDRCDTPCSNSESCVDSNPCTSDRCINSLCTNIRNVRYGDVVGSGGSCNRDGDVDLTDVLAVLDGFAGQFAVGCELVNMDIAGDGGSCVPNGSIDLSDILGVLDAFQGVDRCCG